MLFQIKQPWLIHPKEAEIALHLEYSNQAIVIHFRANLPSLCKLDSLQAAIYSQNSVLFVWVTKQLRERDVCGHFPAIVTAVKHQVMEKSVTSRRYSGVCAPAEILCVSDLHISFSESGAKPSQIIVHANNYYKQSDAHFPVLSPSGLFGPMKAKFSGIKVHWGDEMSPWMI